MGLYIRVHLLFPFVDKSLFSLSFLPSCYFAPFLSDHYISLLSLDFDLCHSCILPLFPYIRAAVLDQCSNESH